MSLGQVLTVGNLRNMIKGLDDDCEVVVTARQKISLQDRIDTDNPIPYNFTSANLTLEDINKDEKLIHFECEIPSQYDYQEN